MKINVSKTTIWKISSPAATTLDNVVRDYFRFRDAVTLNRAYFEAPPTDNLLFDDVAPMLAFGGTVSDRFKFLDFALSAADTSPTVSDNMSFVDLILFGLDEIITDTLSFTDTQSYQLAAVLAVRDILTLDDSIDAKVALYVVLADLLDFDDWTGFSFAGDILDTLGLTDTFQAKVSAFNAQLDTLDLTDNVPDPGLWLILPAVQDTLKLEDSRGSMVALVSAIQDSIRFGALLIDGDDQYAGWAINTRVAGASRMTNFNFNSMHRVKGVVYGASTTGIYKLEGADDAGTEISPELVTGLMDLANGRQTRVRQMYLGVLTDAKIVVKTVDSDGVERWYESHAPVGNMNTARIPLGRKPSSRLWQFKVMRQPGEKFDVSRIELFPVLLRRRIHNG